MKKILSLVLALLVLTLPALSLAENEVYVLAAASLTDAMDEIIENYKAVAPDVSIIASYDSSGKLLTQIQQGAPADVFISAAQKQMNTLEEEGALAENTRIDLLENKVVLVVPQGKDAPASFESIADAPVIAVGDPDVVPAGSYAKTILTYLNLWDKLAEETGKLILAGNVREVLTYVATGNADCGVVYATDAMIEPGVAVMAEAPEGSCEKIIYPAARLASSVNSEAAQAFLDYVTGEEGAAVLTKYGFAMCEPDEEAEEQETK